MDNNKIDIYIMSNSKFFEPTIIPILRSKLTGISEEKFLMLQSVDLQDPNIMLIVSIFLGSLGIDRFMIGDIGIGVLKLLTMGLCGILTIVDWFMISKKTKQLNFSKISQII